MSKMLGIMALWITLLILVGDGKEGKEYFEMGNWEGNEKREYGEENRIGDFQDDEENDKIMKMKF